MDILRKVEILKEDLADVMFDVEETQTEIELEGVILTFDEVKDIEEIIEGVETGDFEPKYEYTDNVIDVLEKYGIDVDLIENEIDKI